MTVKNLNFTKYFFLLILISWSSALAAQKDLDKDDDFEKRWKDTPNRYHNWGFHFDGNWNDNDWDNFRVGLIDIGFSTYMYKGSLNLPAELDEFDQTYGGSLNFNLHALRHRVPLIKDKFGLEYGLSLSWKQYRFSNDFRILEDTIPFSIKDDGVDYKKNKLKTTFLEIPLMLTISPGRNSAFYLSGGIYGGILLGAKQKLKDEDGNKFKIRDDFNLNKFRYGVVGRIGFGPVALYAQAALNELFKEGQGPELIPFNIGISLLDF